MSAILKTLKKLEEEKNLLEQNLDIEEMVKQSETITPSATRQRKTGFLASLLGLVAVLFTVYYVYQSKQPEQLVENALPLPNSTVSLIPKIMSPLKKAQSTSGIPLAQIPETADSISSPPNKKPLSVKKTTQQSVESPEETNPLAKQKEEVVPSMALKKIHTLIEEAKLAAKREKSSPPKIESRRNLVYIPGLKVKGIVFLTENNPVNHIFISTSNNKHQKLKVGQIVLGATLKAIHSDKVVFFYKNQIIETGIGE